MLRTFYKFTVVRIADQNFSQVSIKLDDPMRSSQSGRSFVSNKKIQDSEWSMMIYHGYELTAN